MSEWLPMSDRHKVARKIVEYRLGKLPLSVERREEIIAEISAHLEDHYEDLLRQGNSEEESRQLACDALSQDEGGELFRQIQSALPEDTMNHRVKTFWLPAMVATIAALGLLQLLPMGVAQPKLIHTLISGPIPFRLWSGAYMFFNWRWLVFLPLIGALAAYWSRRTGGRLFQRALAASAPALGFGGFVTLFIFIVSLPHIGRSPESLGIWVTALGMVFTIWVILPALALLLGALPFLRGQNRGSAVPSVAQ